MSVAIIAADLHLLKKPGMWSGRAEISGDDVFALTQIAKLAEEYDADLYLLGDVLDSVTNLPRPIVAAQDALGPLAVNGRLFFLQGQHEIVVQAHYENHPWLSLIPGAAHIGGSEFEFMGVKAFGMDYFPAAFEGLAFSKVPKDTRILFMHGTCDLAHPMAAHFNAESLDQFPDLQLVFAGDYHEALDLWHGNVRIYYTGSTWQTAADEQREKSVLLVKQEGTKLLIDRVPLKTRKILKMSEIYEDGEVDVDLFLVDKDLPKEIQTPVLLIDIPTPPEMYEELAKHAHLYTTSGANPDVPTTEGLENAAVLSNEQILTAYVDKEKHPEQFAFTLDVIENGVEDAVSRLKEQLGIKDDDLTVTVDSSTEINLGGGAEEEEEVLS